MRVICVPYACYVLAMCVLYACYVRATCVLYECYVRAVLYVSYVCVVCTCHVRAICVLYVCAMCVLHVLKFSESMICLKLSSKSSSPGRDIHRKREREIGRSG